MVKERCATSLISARSIGVVPIGVLGLGALVLVSGGGGAAALPRSLPGAGDPHLVLVDEVGAVEAPAPAAASEGAPFAELNAALAAARAKLEELSKAAEVAAEAGRLRQELQALKDENRRLKTELSSLEVRGDQRKQADQAAEARLAELTKAAEDAARQAERVENELVALRWQNAQLNTSLARAQAARERAEGEARETKKTLQAKLDSLSKAGETSSAERETLRKQIESGRRKVALAEQARSEAEVRLGELQAALKAAEQRSAQLNRQLETARTQLKETSRERDEARERITTLDAELTAAKAEITQVTSVNRQLKADVTALRAAASSATAAARENLVAVEDQVKQLTAALGGATARPGSPATVGGEGPVASSGDGRPLGGRREDGAQQVPAEGAKVALGGPTLPLPPPSRPEASVAPVAARSDHGAEAAVETDLELVKSANAAETKAPLGTLTGDLPLEKRLQVQGLLVDLDATVDTRGVRMTVPGATLFALNSDQIQDAAYETLAKVAELVDVYGDHRVLIVGHTDSVGESGYNQTLSERRAELVKRFFVENFGIDANRLATQGLGEQQPIASNATLDGRRANRRVEVVILN